MRKMILPVLALVTMLAACNNAPATKKEVKQYSVEQLYNNKSMSGVAFSTDESKILVNADITGIYNLYELNISDTVLKPLTSSVKESFYAIDYLPGTNKFLYS